MNSNPISYSSQQDEQFEKDYREIFLKIENFIDEEINKSNKLHQGNKIFSDKISVAVIAIAVLLVIYSSILVILVKFKELLTNNLWVFNSISYLILGAILILTFIAFQQIYKKNKDLPQKLIKKMGNQGLNDRKISQELSYFSIATLKYADIRLKLLIENQSIINTKWNNILPFIALILAAYSIYSSESSNWTISKIMLASGLILIILKGLTEFFNEQALYKRCVSIIEYALILAEKNQEVEQKI